MRDVESSNIQAIGYKPDTRHLRVQFRGGGLYQYGSVSSQRYKAFEKADSKGRYFSKNIRDQYPTEHINKLDLGDVLTRGRQKYTGFRSGSKLRKHIEAQTGKKDFSQLSQADLRRLHDRFSS